MRHNTTSRIFFDTRPLHYWISNLMNMRNSFNKNENVLRKVLDKWIKWIKTHGKHEEELSVILDVRMNDIINN